MKILVLGNGFDLDHNLPTSYMDFLNFCNCVLDIDNPESTSKEKLCTTQLEYIKYLEKYTEVRDTFLSFVKNNKLLTYFNNRIAKQGKNWIDFEREIKGIVNEFKSVENEFKKSNQHIYLIEKNHKIKETLKNLGLESMYADSWDEYTLDAIHNDLIHQLKNFSQALEYYLATFVNTTPIIGVSPDIIDFDADSIITFNYTNTYERHYGGVKWNETISHIHGVAQSEIGNDTNIILGITSPQNNNENSYVEFEKYFQRITKKTGSEYKEWLSRKSNKNKHIEVVFFGHSLDSTDIDIINDLICNENTLVTIYYYNNTAYQSIVSNLIEIIGKQQIINYVSGKQPKITFKRQSQHQTDTTAGIEIERDIRNLYKLYTYKEEDINRLLKKIDTKLENKDISYLHTQRKTIDLFETLQYIGVPNYTKEAFLEHCNSLNFEKTKSGDLKRYYADEWFGETSWGDTIYCSEETKQLIEMVNKSNMERSLKEIANEPYSYFSEFKTTEDFKKALLDIFTTEPSDAYWKNLYTLMDRMVENEDFSTAITALEKESHPLSIKAKIKHFYMAYNEAVYDSYLRKQWEEEQRNNQIPNE